MVSYISVRVHEWTAKLEARAMHGSWDTVDLTQWVCKVHTIKEPKNAIPSEGPSGL